MKKPRRRVNGKKVLAFLVLGLVINIGVALVFARWGSRPGRALNSSAVWTRHAALPPRWPGPVPEQWGKTPTKEHERRQGTPDDPVYPLHFVARKLGWWSESLFVGRFECGSGYEVNCLGFPLGALRFDNLYWSDTISFPEFGEEPAPGYHGGVRVPDKDWAFMRSRTIIKYTIPLVPVWSGLIVNTLFYAGVLWLIVYLVGLEQARYRRVLGLCAACGYDVTGLSVCPECGQGVR